MAIVAEKRLYETPDGELVEELEDSGSLFCGVGTELEGPEAKRYLAYVEAQKPAKPKLVKKEATEEKAAEKAEDKAAAPAQDKSAKKEA